MSRRGRAKAKPADEAGPWATPRDAGTVIVRVPHDLQEHVASLFAELEALEVTPDSRARVVINERTGTVVLGDGVRLTPVAIAHGGLTLKLRGQEVSQPAPNTKGTTKVVPKTTSPPAKSPVS